LAKLSLRANRGIQLPTGFAFHSLLILLSQRTPHYSFSTLAKWWKDGTVEHRRRVLMYYIARVELDINLVEETEMISRNASVHFVSEFLG
jgi:DNA polymerase zeta